MGARKSGRLARLGGVQKDEPSKLVELPEQRMKFAVEIVARGIDYPRFRQVYYSEEFNRDVAVAVKLKERTQIEYVKLPDGKERRKVRVVPRIQPPAAIQKLLNGRPLHYEETTVFDPATRSASFDVESAAGETLQVTGLVRFVEEPGGMRLRFEGEARVKGFGLGALAQRYIVGEVKGRYEVIQTLLQKFIDEGRASAVTPLSTRPPDPISA